MLDASIIICAHNPRPNYLNRVLDALRRQTAPLGQWELLLVDNASKIPLESTWDISWHPNARHVLEGNVGVTYARQRGIRESSTDLLIFVDDDNVLDPNYLVETIKIRDEWPELGVWGSGILLPEFEVEPPDYLKDLVPKVALRSANAIHFSNVPTCNWAAPWGAGLCVRANVATAYSQVSQQSSLRILGRTGTTLISGEDIEIDYVACSLGCGMAIFPELRITHLIPKERVTEDYLIRLYEGTSLSDYLLAYKWRGKMPRDPYSAMGLIDILANVLVRRGLERRMFFAKKRAARKALNMIKSAGPMASLWVSHQ